MKTQPFAYAARAASGTYCNMATLKFCHFSKFVAVDTLAQVISADIPIIDVGDITIDSVSRINLKLFFNPEDRDTAMTIRDQLLSSGYYILEDIPPVKIPHIEHVPYRDVNGEIKYDDAGVLITIPVKKIKLQHTTDRFVFSYVST